MSNYLIDRYNVKKNMLIVLRTIRSYSNNDYYYYRRFSFQIALMSILQLVLLFI